MERDGRDAREVVVVAVVAGVTAVNGGAVGAVVVCVAGGNGSGVCGGRWALSPFILDGRGVILWVIVEVIAVRAGG